MCGFGCVLEEKDGCVLEERVGCFLEERVWGGLEQHRNTDVLDTKAIVVKCFHKGENITFRSNVIFAPFGEWSKANENVGFSEYKLKI